jgi:hypothetical protein
VSHDAIGEVANSHVESDDGVGHSTVCEERGV